MPGAGPSVSPPPGAERAVPSLCTAGLLSSHSGVFVFYVILCLGEPLADSVALEIEVHGFVVMPLTFFRRMVGHRLGTPSASVEHARPCACHVLSPDVTQGARRSGQGRSFAGASGFLPDVSWRGPRLLRSVQPGPAGLWLSSRRVFLAACPAAPRHQLPAAPAPPSAPRPAPSPQSPCSACLCRSPLSCGAATSPAQRGTLGPARWPPSVWRGVCSHGL